jgi:dTDP-4-dehydrorhamnose reductase
LKVLVLGSNGLIGKAMTDVLSLSNAFDVYGTVRDEISRRHFASQIRKNIFANIDVLDYNSVDELINKLQPDVIINCVGLTKHVEEANNSNLFLSLNAVYPRKLALSAELLNVRLIHISTDCVFLGDRGQYTENDKPDALDQYGITKALGEIYSINALTIRTSTIGHELESKHGLLEWFLSQKDKCSGYRNAIFSGLPAVVLGTIVRDIVIPRSDLVGLYHIGSNPINKYDLLKLISSIYDKKIDIVPDDSLHINRSLSSEKFKMQTGYQVPNWSELVEIMYSFNLDNIKDLKKNAK